MDTQRSVGRPPLPDDERKRITSVMLPMNLREMIKDMAAYRGCSKSQVIRALLEAGTGMKPGLSLRQDAREIRARKRSGMPIHDVTLCRASNA